MKWLTWLTACLALLITSQPALAFKYRSCLGHPLKFSSITETVHASTVGFPAGYWARGIQDTVDKFNNNPSRFRYVLDMKQGKVGRNNGQNEIWGSKGAILKNAPAIAYTYWTCYWLFGDHVHIDESDVIYDYGLPWQWTADNIKSSLIGYTGSLRAIQTTAAHELGHGLGLAHENREYNIMGNDFEHIHVNGSIATAYTGEDAADAMIFLYRPRAPAWEDLGVVHWKYFGASGEYSDHTKTVIYDTSGAILPTVVVNGETGYLASRGQTVRAEFTYENNGANFHRNVQVGYHISSNDLITTLDRKIGSNPSILAEEMCSQPLWTLSSLRI